MSIKLKGRSSNLYIFRSLQRKKYNWIIHENLFSLTNQNSIFLTGVRIQNYLTKFQNILALSRIRHPQVDSHMEQRFFLSLFLFVLQFNDSSEGGFELRTSHIHHRYLTTLNVSTMEAFNTCVVLFFIFISSEDVL